MDSEDSASSAASSTTRGSARIGPDNVIPPTSADWKKLARRGGDPVLLVRQGRAILDASPIWVTADGRRLCLDTEETIRERQSARLALGASLHQYAGLTRDLADRMVDSLFVHGRMNRSQAYLRSSGSGLEPFTSATFGAFSSTYRQWRC
jgi:hypothetical protein